MVFKAGEMKAGIAIIALLVCSSMAPINACQDEDTFQEYCVHQFFGTADGSSCFFSPNAIVDWTKAWTTCAQFGGVLAQIHTDSEWAKVAELLKIQYPGKPGTLPGDGIWLAAARRSNFTNKCNGAAPAATTYWFKDATTVEIYGADTWLRNHECDGFYDPTADCIKIWLHAVGPVIEDHPCNVPMGILCQYTGPMQNFTMTNSCLAETPINQFSAMEIDECEHECNKQRSCRSFNYITSSSDNKCELFSWSIYDSPAGPKTANVSGCQHYNYVP